MIKFQDIDMLCNGAEKVFKIKKYVHTLLYKGQNIKLTQI